MNQSTGFLDINRYAEGETVVKTVSSAMDDYIDILKSENNLKYAKTVENYKKRLIKLGFGDLSIKEVSSKKGIIKFWSNPEIYGLAESTRTKIRSVLGTTAEKFEAGLGKQWEGLAKSVPAELDKLVEGQFFPSGARATYDLQNVGDIYKHINKIKDKEARLYATIKAFSGVRSTELARMTLDNLQLNSKEIVNVGARVEGIGGKGSKLAAKIGKDYTISPIVETAFRELEEMAIARGDTKLFTKSETKLTNLAVADLRKYITKPLYEFIDGKKTKVPFQFKMFRNIIMGAAEDLEYQESAIKDLGGHTKASDITKGYSRTKVFPQIKTGRLNYITHLQNKFLEAAGFESPKQFGIGNQLKYANTLESALDLKTVPKIESTVAQTQPSIEKLKAESATLGETLEEIKLQQRQGLEEIQKSVQKTTQPKTTKVNRLLERIRNAKKGLKTTLLATGAGVAAEILTKSKPAIAATKVIAGAIPAFDPMQALNEAFGGKEGVLPTTKSGNILGFIPPTTSKESESWSDLLGIPTYPEGHPKEGQHILSTAEYKKMQMPEELEQFEQQGRF